MSITDSARVGTTDQEFGGRETIVPIETPTLGDRSYLVHDGRVAVVIDPLRDLDRALAVADAAGVRIT